MKKLTPEELTAARIAGDFKLLWEQAIPMVKHAIRKLAFSKEWMKTLVTEDMKQNAYLVAGMAVRSWEPAKGNLYGWVEGRVQGAVYDYLRRSNGMVGGRDSATRTALFDDEYTESGENTLTEELLNQQQTCVAVRAAWHELPHDMHALIGSRFGLSGEEPLDTEELMARYKLSRGTFYRTLNKALKKLEQLVSKSRTYVVEAENIDDADQHISAGALRRAG